MKRMKTILSVYCIAYFVLLMFVFGLQYVYPKLELHLLLNSYHTSIQDTFFKYYSMMAEWPLYVLALLPLLWKKIKITLFFAMCELSGGTVLQILKHTITTERPISAFENCHNMILPVVEGVNLHHSNSFPSGHASTFFVFCTCCALILVYHYKLKAENANNLFRRGADHSQPCQPEPLRSTDNRKRRKFHLRCIFLNLALLSLLTLAALGAYSRIYLSQHFLSDVCMGSIIGFVTPCLIFYFGGKKILKLKNV